MTQPIGRSDQGPLSLEDRRSLVEKIHGAPGMIVLAVTGGGIAAITDLMLVPGASRTVLEVIVPYAGAAMADLVGPDGPTAVSTETADAMAAACLARGKALANPGTGVAGVACTAALVTDRERRGSDRAWIGVATDEHLRSFEVTLTKAGAESAGSSRVEQDRAVADHVLRAIAEALGLRD